ncbi:asparagine synthase-related protein [Phytoactinopolyspora endophytica]|uniref:asparagine synthase-related protein n=1 Tax=Phytoactinopolyspora endophytica TaxID=1642495 RepID=UPI0013EE1AFD|nr:asparagine synthase-related protein [Phytoactinopolyspora endophytica]
MAISPREAFERAIMPALAREPCFVAFSGGRDSSAVLAVATALARREGLSEPVPVTEIYPGVDEADESEWQQLVVEHLGLTDWVRVQVHGENDLLGESARAGLLRRGLVWPAVFQVKDRLMGEVSGGSLLTGEGGDEALTARRITPVTLLVRKRRPWSRRLLGAAAWALAPAALRRARERRAMSTDDDRTWLRPAVRREHVRRAAADEAAEPLRWDRATWWLRRQRASSVLFDNYAALAAEYGVVAHHPFADATFLASLARAGGGWGYPGRTAMMRMLFSDLLPDEVLRRSSKAGFDRAFMGEATREFARSWDGSGVNTELVDPEALRAAWCSDRPSTMSGLLLQSAWLAAQPVATERIET